MTLIELTVGLSILGLMSILTIKPMVSTFGFLVSSSEIRERWDDSAMALKRISSEIRDAKAVTVEAGDPQRLHIKKCHAASDGYENVVFYVDGSTLYRQGEPSGKAIVMVENVGDMSVTYDGLEGSLIVIRMKMVTPEGEDFWMDMKAYPMNLEDAETKSFYNDDEKSGDWELVIR